MSNDFDIPKEAVVKKGELNKEKPGTAAADEKEKPEKPEYDSEELLRIFDEMIFSGSYTEVVQLKGGKLKIAFRTRTASEVELITKTLDTTTANLMATLVEKRSVINLYYALTSFQGKDLSMLKLEERSVFINNLAAPIVGALIIALDKFDRKVYEATKEGEVNF